MSEDPASNIDLRTPAEYLNQAPTADEHVLAEQVDLHDGAPVPFWMIAKIAIRLQRIAVWVGRMDALYRRGRRYVMVGVSAAAMNISAVGVNWLHADEARVAASERAAAAEREFNEYRRTTDEKIQELRLDVRELRSELRRMSGADQPKTDGSEYRSPPDKLSLFEEWSSIMVDVVPVGGLVCMNPPCESSP